MTYTKPFNISYQQMCIWIDENAYTDNIDEQKLYEYLYHIILMLAKKHKYFNNDYDYDTFALEGATRVFLRLTNAKNNNNGTYDKTGKVNQKITSVLNYINKILSPMRVDYMAKYKSTINRTVPLTQEIAQTFSFQQQLEETLDNIKTLQFDDYLHAVDKTIDAYLFKLPYDKDVKNNLILQCKLSLLNSLTLSFSSMDRLKNNKWHNPDLLYKLYALEKDNCVILWNLDADWKPYVQVIVNNLQHIICKDLREILATTAITTHTNIENVLSSQLSYDNGDNI